MSHMKHNINRRKFLGLFGSGCCSLLMPSCATVPITERKQLSIIPEATINRQAAAAYENFRSKTKLITKGSQLREVKEIGKKMENAVSTFFLKSSDIISDNKSIFISNNNNQFFSIDINSGSFNWKNKINSSLRPSIVQNILFSVSNEGYLILINKNNGNIIRVSDIFKNFKIKDTCIVMRVKCNPLQKK